MNVGMVIQFLPPGMKDGHDRRFSAHVTLILTESEERIIYTVKEKRKQKLFICPDQGIELLRKCHDYMIIGDTFDQFCFAFCDPLFFLRMLTAGQERLLQEALCIEKTPHSGQTSKEYPSSPVLHAMIKRAVLRLLSSRPGCSASY